MAVKVVIERKVIPGQERRVLEQLRALRIRCLDEPGYITGETLRDSEDPNNLVVISTWFGLGDWRRWTDLGGPAEIRIADPAAPGGPRAGPGLLEGLTESHSGA